MDRALIVSGSEKEIETVKQLLKAMGDCKITSALSGGEARRIISSEEFELVVIDAPLPDEFGNELSVRISELSTAGIIMICRNGIADDISEKASESGIIVVSKPVNRQSFYQSLRLAEATQKRMQGQKKENAVLLTKIEEMRLINRAKCTLMQYLKFTESQAHKYIEKQAMNSRRTRKEVAMKILADYER